MDLKNRIEELKKKKKAVILAHNYQVLEVQHLADFVGDSLELARKSTGVDADIIVFAGVYFMAETAKILNPDKKVLIPEIEARCPMADMVTASDIRRLREQYPDAGFVAYVNTNADVKAEVDIICTSANAVKVVNSMPQKRIVFVPDKNLGNWVKQNTDKEVILYHGYCYVHDEFEYEKIKRLKEENPDAVMLVHPEAPPQVVEMADEVVSTSGMLRYAASTDARKIIVVTEEGLLDMLREKHPDKIILSAGRKAICEDMKKITPESILRSLEEEKYEITIPPDTMERARGAIEKMLKIK